MLFILFCSKKHIFTQKVITSCTQIQFFILKINFGTMYMYSAQD